MRQPYTYQLLPALTFFLAAQATSVALPPQPLKKKDTISTSYHPLSKEKRALFLKTFQEEKGEGKWPKTVEMLKKEPLAVNIRFSKEEQAHFPTDQATTFSLMHYVIYEELDSFVEKISELNQVVKVLDFGFEELEQGQSPFDGFFLTNLFYTAWDYTHPQDCDIIKGKTPITKDFSLSLNAKILLRLVMIYKEQTKRKENIDGNYILNQNYQNPNLLLSANPL